jgi:hypothetical protein
MVVEMIDLAGPNKNDPQKVFCWSHSHGQYSRRIYEFAFMRFFLKPISCTVNTFPKTTEPVWFACHTILNLHLGSDAFRIEIAGITYNRGSWITSDKKYAS